MDIIEQVAQALHELEPRAEAEIETLTGEDTYGAEVSTGVALFVRIPDHFIQDPVPGPEGEAYWIRSHKSVFAGKWNRAHEIPIAGDHEQPRDVALALVYACEIDCVLKDLDALYEQQLEL